MAKKPHLRADLQLNGARINTHSWVHENIDRVHEAVHTIDFEIYYGNTSASFSYRATEPEIDKLINTLNQFKKNVMQTEASLTRATTIAAPALSAD